MTRSSLLTRTAFWLTLAVALVVFLFPIYWMVNTSLKPSEEIFLSPPSFYSVNWTFDAYFDVLANRPLLRYLFNSFIVATGTTIVAVTLSALTAYGFTRFKIRFATAFIVFLIFTKMLPETLLIIPYFQLMSKLGLINTYLSLILAYSSFALPFAAWILIGFFRSIPTELDEAAMIDGASRLDIFLKVVLPLARPGLVAVAMFTFLLAWNAYVFALVLTTDADMFVISVGVANLVGEYQVEWNELMAAALVGAAPVLVIFSILNRHLVEAITAGALKG